MPRDILEDYLTYLLREYRIEDRKYTKLFQRLFDTPFDPVLEADEARIDDGLEVRGRWYRSIPDFPCSVLEVLLALADRMDSEYVGDPSEEGTNDIFYLFLDNLGLLYYTDRRYNDLAIDNILEIWMERRFHSNGDGSIFPLKYTRENQRDCSLWSQMQSYIIENY